MQALLDRRQLLERLSLLLGAAVSAPVASGLLAGCRPRPAGEPLRVLDEERLRLVGRLAERILPRTDTPGALDAGVDRFVDAMLERYVGEDDRVAYLVGLDRLEVRSRDRWGSRFADCEPGQQDELLAELDRATFAGGTSPGIEDADRRFYRLHKELTVSGYYTSRIGQTEELRPMPLGAYRGDVPIGPEDKAWS